MGKTKTASTNNAKKVRRVNETPGDAAPAKEATPASNQKSSPSSGSYTLTEADLRTIHTRDDLIKLLTSRGVDVQPALDQIRYAEELLALQIEMVKLQRWVQQTHRRVAILFEGRDASGTGSAIRSFVRRINPRAMRVVALPRPTEQEKGQWYFQRYARLLPNQGEIVFFNRSCYNRAVAEPVRGLCSEQDYERFMHHVPEYEHMLYEDGVSIIKFWFSLSPEEQMRRFKAQRDDVFNIGKRNPMKANVQALWDKYTHHKEQMFIRTHTSFSPWIIVRADDRQRARLESIRHVLHLFPYTGKEDASVRTDPDPNVIVRFHRESAKID